MNLTTKAILPLLLSFALNAAAAPAPAQTGVAAWVTSSDRSDLLRQSPPIPLTATPATGQVITLDPAQSYQTMDGFGFALTEGSAQLLMHMDPASRAALLQNLFTTTGDNIGVSYLRLSIGASDMNADVYSYDDLPAGQTDPSLAHFNLDHDRVALIPLLKEILAIDPKIDILGSPWSAPLWMKTNGGAQGGVLKPEDFPAYAQYFVKYIQGMKAEGITIDAITVQNEPLNEKNTPSMLMLAPEQADFIARDLGPAFRKAGIRTKIILYDHNLDHPLYPLSILRDPAAAKYVDGSGFHLYGGSVDAMTQVHDAFPSKNIYFTEQSITQRDNADPMDISRTVAEVIIGVSRNWSRNVLLWNLAADPANRPHTSHGGCSGCSGAITIDGDHVRRNVAYYTLAQASKFVRPGAVRIGSNNLETLPNVAFKTPDGKRVLIVSNTSGSTQRFTVQSGTQSFATSLEDGSVATYVW